MASVNIVLGLGFGDEGKGTVVDYLASRYDAKLVVRFNGGAQAGHNVLVSGQHHTFSQFGSGTFAGARTHLSRYMLVNPLTAMNEARALQDRHGITNPFERMTIELDALITTPFHVQANRHRERTRGGNAHGSCGMGIGETMYDSLSSPESEVVRARDLLSPDHLRDKLERIYAKKRKEFPGFEVDSNMISDTVERYTAFTKTGVKFVTDRWLHNVLQENGHIIFEGAQGALLDQHWGFHPHTTWTDCTFGNAMKLLDGTGVDHVRKIGVLRAYHTRHGAGPFPTGYPHLDRLSTHDHNKTGEWQGAFRSGWFDYVLARYALEVAGPVDGLAITNIDRLAKEPELRVGVGYGTPDGPMPGDLFETADSVASRIIKGAEVDLGRQRRITDELFRVYTAFKRVRHQDYAYEIASWLGLPIVVTSSGADRKDKNSVATC